MTTLEYMLLCTGIGVWWMGFLIVSGAMLGWVCYKAGELGAMRYLGLALTGYKVWGDPDDPAVRKAAVRRIRELREKSRQELSPLGQSDDDDYDPQEAAEAELRRLVEER